jgi:hypothetical protein
MTGRPNPTPIEWLLLVLGLVLVVHYAWLLDDAYVYFRYVDNFVHYGLGWVYNAGEYVEGYTSPLWLLLLTALRALGADYWLLVRALGLLSFAAFWWGLVVLARDLRSDRAPIVNVPMLFLVPNYATLTYFTSGVEAPAVQVAAIAYALFLIRPQRRVAGAVVALSPLIRPELALAFVLALAFAWWRERRIPWRVGLIGALTTGSWVAFRIYYYADLLPNTFYLKHVALLSQGLTFVHQSLVSYGVYPLAMLALTLFFVLSRRGVATHGAARAGMLGIALFVAAYFTWLGGDARHHRYLVFSFCLAACAMGGLAEHAISEFARSLRPTWIAVGSAVLLLVFGSLFPPQLSRHPIWRNSEHLPVDLINDAEWHRNRGDLAPPAWSFEPLGSGVPAAEVEGRALWDGEYEHFVSSMWCADNYWWIDRGVIHSAGLTDAILARIPATSVRPAHKPALAPRAREIARLRAAHPPEVGLFRRALREPQTPGWIRQNIDALEVIERKIYNEHDWFENLRLALRPVPAIDTSPKLRARRLRGRAQGARGDSPGR